MHSIIQLVRVAAIYGLEEHLGGKETRWCQRKNLLWLSDIGGFMLPRNIYKQFLEAADIGCLRGLL